MSDDAPAASWAVATALVTASLLRDAAALATATRYALDASPGVLALALAPLTDLGFPLLRQQDRDRRRRARCGSGRRLRPGAGRQVRDRARAARVSGTELRPQARGVLQGHRQAAPVLRGPRRPPRPVRGRAGPPDPGEERPEE